MVEGAQEGGRRERWDFLRDCRLREPGVFQILLDSFHYIFLSA